MGTTQIFLPAIRCRAAYKPKLAETAITALARARLSRSTAALIRLRQRCVESAVVGLCK